VFILQERKPVARPTKYKPEYANIAKKMCELGATDFDVVEALDIVRSTFYKWKYDHPEFSDALKVGKTDADDRVEMSLYKRAVGYEYDTVKIFQFQGEEVVVPYKEIQQPDTTAAIFWLKNRRKNEWRASPEGESQQVVIQNIMPVPNAASVDDWESSSKSVHDELLNKDD